ncbi:NAD(P)/FAD-dependent oxidoreductase [Roseococcus microcysteis]|uniref:NAD(P)/FAD-dependent oxidoreductase n=1 Tax=Roseococcus microcysteis TaxID=2771361 RepID=UPI00168A6308|nr:FAD-binding oxidoreductase [Roseococcus microcysteis]
MRMSFDIAVVGGGIVGLAVARGLAGRGLGVAILDEGDVARRASRGNFALVWVQSKGLGMARYGAWTTGSAALWPGFAAALRAETGHDVSLAQPGGYSLCLSEEELDRRRAAMMRMHNQPGWEPIPWEVQDHDRIARAMPGLGRDVVGGVFCPLDGHVNSLRLFRALHTSALARGATYLPDHPVRDIAPLPGGGFRLTTAQGEIEAGRVVLAAGLGNAALAPMVGLTAPVRPQRGQVMVTERTTPFLRHPVATLRQTDEGSVMIGDSKEENPVDEAVGPGVLAAMARRAARMFPVLGGLNIVRSWGALRVMSKDGFPVYDESATAPGAFLVTCHSGVTLAAAHSEVLAPMIAGGGLEDSVAAFSARRFDVPSAA